MECSITAVNNTVASNSLLPQEGAEAMGGNIYGSCFRDSHKIRCRRADVAVPPLVTLHPWLQRPTPRCHQESVFLFGMVMLATRGGEGVEGVVMWGVLEYISEYIHGGWKEAAA